MLNKTPMHRNKNNLVKKKRKKCSNKTKNKSYTPYEKGYSINQVNLILVRRGIKEPRLLSQASESREIRQHYLKPLFLEAGYRGQGN